MSDKALTERNLNLKRKAEEALSKNDPKAPRSSASARATAPSKPAVTPSSRPMLAAQKPSSITSRAPASATVRSSLSSVSKATPAPRQPLISSRKPGAPSSSSAAASASARPTSAANSANAANSSKRPPWDLRGRLQDMEDMTNLLQQQIASSDQSFAGVSEKLEQSQNIIYHLELFRKQLEENVQAKTEESKTYEKSNYDLANQIDDLKRQQAQETSSLKHRHQLEMDDLQMALSSQKRNFQSLENDYNNLRDENTSLKNTISSQSATLVSAEGEMRALRLKLEISEKDGEAKSARISQLEKEVAELQETNRGLEEKVRADEMVRRKLHNTILELKGNIRVFCRVRPPLGEEQGDAGTLSHISFNESDDKEITLLQNTESASGGKSAVKTLPFSFDKVFRPGSSQGEVFEEISQLVQSALDGYKVCIFAYGQTGSGKTYTMEGPPRCFDNQKELGMIPRAVYQIFETAQALQHKGWRYQMEVSFLEIYNESLRDLLGANDPSKKFEIKHNAQCTSVTDLTTVTVTTPEKVFSLLKKASENRAVGETQMNERSSRSHSVFILKLSGHNSITEERCEGVLNLIDLAGSERLSSSGATGDRLKETQAINKSLSSLADVIYSLANKEAHVPYRNSKLTYLLQNSLGGNSKTLMFVNVSPLVANFQETVCSLRFATKVNSCDIGTAKKSSK